MLLRLKEFVVHATEIQNFDPQYGMMVQFDSLYDDSVVHTLTLMPRLTYSSHILDGLISQLNKKRKTIRIHNRLFLIEYNDADIQDKNALELERTLVFSLEMLGCIKNRIGSISNVTNIPKRLSTTIPVLRTISAKLFEVLPECSQKLNELSIYLGSVILDSATLTNAKFDFSQSNIESSCLLDEVKLIADSKISKQYPNLDFLKFPTT